MDRLNQERPNRRCVECGAEGVTLEENDNGDWLCDECMEEWTTLYREPLDDRGNEP